MYINYCQNSSRQRTIIISSLMPVQYPSLLYFCLAELLIPGNGTLSEIYFGYLEHLDFFAEQAKTLNTKTKVTVTFTNDSRCYYH